MGSTESIVTWPTQKEDRAESVSLGPVFVGGAAGNRTRVLCCIARASPCAVRYASTWISRSREQVRMTIPATVWCSSSSRGRMNRWAL